jgi:hypothetical protein
MHYVGDDLRTFAARDLGPGVAAVDNADIPV